MESENKYNRKNYDEQLKKLKSCIKHLNLINDAYEIIHGRNNNVSYTIKHCITDINEAIDFFDKYDSFKVKEDHELAMKQSANILNSCLAGIELEKQRAINKNMY